MLRSGPANDMANPATEQATATPIIAGHAAPSMLTVVSNTAEARPCMLSGVLP